MERILRGEGPWQEAIADALRLVPRPIAADPRLLPRDVDDAPRRDRWDRSGFPPARAASTLLLVYPAADGSLTIPLTVRHAALRTHAGEVSLPGGAVDPTDASAEAAALREAHEEVGVEPGLVRVLGMLDPVWIPVSNFELQPFVGAVARRPVLRPHVAEVASIVEMPLAHLLSEAALTEELIEGDGWRLQAGVYRYGGQRIWGATARILAMFTSVMRLLPSERSAPGADGGADR
jgi:8-oxo-dGTP pyrophosphatase MutT (NUDIX family)